MASTGFFYKTALNFNIHNNNSTNNSEEFGKTKFWNMYS